MAFHYKKVVPWGRSFDEYISMFHLTEHDLELKILGCGDGPASFNSEMRQKGHQMVSIDPLYRFTAAQIEQRIRETYDDVISQTCQNREKFIWNNIPSVEKLGQIRMSSMQIFLKDFDQGKREKRYITAELPVLPFNDKQFDLALSSHFLFLYTDKLSLDFHIKAIKEMCRVAAEVRIFPLLDVNAQLSPYVAAVKEEVKNKVKLITEEKVNYEFQKNGNKMLKIISAVGP